MGQPEATAICRPFRVETGYFGWTVAPYTHKNSSSFCLANLSNSHCLPSSFLESTPSLITVIQADEASPPLAMVTQAGGSVINAGAREKRARAGVTMAGASVSNSGPRVKNAGGGVMMAGAGVTQAGVGDFRGKSVVDEDGDTDALARISLARSLAVEAPAIANLTKFAKWLTYTGGELEAIAAKSFDELASRLSPSKVLLIQSTSLSLLHNLFLSGAAMVVGSVSRFSDGSSTSLHKHKMNMEGGYRNGQLLQLLVVKEREQRICTNIKLVKCQW